MVGSYCRLPRPISTRTACGRVVLWLGMSVALVGIPFATGFAGPTFKVPVDDVAAFEGSVVLKQIIADEANEAVFNAHLVLVGGLTAEGGKGEVTVIRYAEDSADVAARFGAVESYLVDVSSGAPQLDLKGQPPYEFEENLHMLNVHFPLEVLPLLVLPGVGEEQTSKETVNVLNLAHTEAEITVATRQDGDSIEVVRALKAGSQPSFSFRDETATLTNYRVTYKLYVGTGALASVDSECAFELSPGGGEEKIRIERKVRLKSKEGSADWRVAADALAAVDGAFGKRLPSSEIEKSIAKFSAAAADTPLAPASKALNVRLNAFRMFFEATPQGKMLAKLLGGTAPEFKLKGLDDKEVSFHAAIKNKVTLLSFWGVG